VEGQVKLVGEDTEKVGLAVDEKLLRARGEKKRLSTCTAKNSQKRPSFSRH
jgi:hypothetical protein